MNTHTQVQSVVPHKNVLVNIPVDRPVQPVRRNAPGAVHGARAVAVH